MKYYVNMNETRKKKQTKINTSQYSQRQMREENYRREKEKGNGIGTRKKNYNKWHKNCRLEYVCIAYL